MHVFSLRCHRSTAACGLGGLLLVVGAARPATAQVYADFETTNGNFTVELYYQDVPRTVANFVSLAEGTRPWLDPRTYEIRTQTPYYDGIIFHRVLKDFMNQGGSPQGTGSDGPGYKFPDELTKSGTGELAHKHGPGKISMANSGTHTNGSQFFIVASTSTPSHLDDLHTVFGEIAAGPFGSAAEGQAAIDAINAVATNAAGRPTVNVVMEKVRIRRVGAAAEAFDELAWQLPVVAPPERDLLNLLYQPAEEEGGHPQVTLEVNPGRGCYYVVEATEDFQNWRGLGLTSVSLDGSLQSFNITGLGDVPAYYVRPRLEVSPVDLIATTLPPLSETAALELKFTNPAMTARVTRAGEAGSWSVTSPTAATGALTTFSYGQGAGEAGLFSPLLGLAFQDALPWSQGATLKTLTATLTFNAGADSTTGYFTASGVTSTNAAVSAKGIFTVTTP